MSTDIKHVGLNAFASDVKAEEDGLWKEVGDMSFLIARVGNDKWKDTYKRLERQAYGHQARKKDKRDAEKDVALMLETLARTSILDWKDVYLDGKAVKYSTEESVKIFTDKRFHKLAELLLDYAMDDEAYLEEEIKNDESLAKK